MEGPTKRLDEYTSFQRLIIAKVWPEIEKTPKDGQTRKLKSKYELQGTIYDIFMDFQLTDTYLKLFRLQVQAGDKVITSTDKKEAEPIYHEIFMGAVDAQGRKLG